MITVNERPVWRYLLEQEGSLTIEDSGDTIRKELADDTLKQWSELSDDELEDKWTD